MNEMKDFVVRLAMVVLLLLGVGVSASAGNEMALRMGGSVVGKIEQNDDIRKSGSIIGKVENLSNQRQAAVMYFFDFFKL